MRNAEVLRVARWILLGAVVPAAWAQSSQQAAVTPVKTPAVRQMERLVKFSGEKPVSGMPPQSNWAAALTDLSASFFSLQGDLTTGVYDVFSTGSGDQLNTFYIPQNQTGEIRVAHPSYATDILSGDDRLGKATVRSVGAASLDGLSSNRDVWVYTSSTAPIPIVRNEELILIYAEANIQQSGFGNAVTALNVIRTAHGLAPYSGAMTSQALLTEMLYERRYSLYCEGHRWIDLRRYQLLGTLPIDRPGDAVWSAFPIPVSEAAN